MMRQFSFSLIFLCFTSLVSSVSAEGYEWNNITPVDGSTISVDNAISISATIKWSAQEQPLESGFIQVYGPSGWLGSVLHLYTYTLDENDTQGDFSGSITLTPKPASGSIVTIKFTAEHIQSGGSITSTKTTTFTVLYK